jgi:prepilin-type N-terminal cleavage/methylation domain-containing protein
MIHHLRDQGILPAGGNSLPGRQRYDRGFTLIELLIVIVIIGILAAIAIPKFEATKEKAHMAKMKADLRNIATAQEAYFNENNTYYSGSLPNTNLVYAASPQVVITLSDVSAAGWAAKATAPSVTTKECALFLGGAAPIAPATIEGRVTCN